MGLLQGAVAGSGKVQWAVNLLAAEATRRSLEQGTRECERVSDTLELRLALEVSHDTHYRPRLGQARLLYPVTFHVLFMLSCCPVHVLRQPAAPSSPHLSAAVRVLGPAEVLTHDLQLTLPTTVLQCSRHRK